MKNILVPIGTSKNSAKTLQYAIDFAETFSSNVFVMQAYSVMSKAGTIANVNEIMERTSTERLEEVIAAVDRKNTNVKIVTYKGDVVDGIKAVDGELGIDLIILSPKSNDIREEVYLGNTSGRIIKKTNIPALIVPEDSVFGPYKSILTAFKSGIVKKESKLRVLQQIKDKYNSAVNLLLVKTPEYTEEDMVINGALMDLSANVAITENATTFQGVLQHFESHQPDLLCVFRRKRGFFTKLWEKNIILKREFFCSIPVLVLSVKKY